MGDRTAHLAAAREMIRKKCGDIVSQSALYQTAAWGLEAQDAFLNQAILIATELGAESLLNEILAIEVSLGRERNLKYGPRIIDIDILFFNNEIISTESLTIPHPEMQNRRFVLVPLCEIAPEYLHPALQKTITQLLEECPDQLDVHKI